jgi:hypothetical protein
LDHHHIAHRHAVSGIGDLKVGSTNTNYQAAHAVTAVDDQ